MFQVLRNAWKIADLRKKIRQGDELCDVRFVFPLLIELVRPQGDPAGVGGLPLLFIPGIPHFPKAVRKRDHSIPLLTNE